MKTDFNQHMLCSVVSPGSTTLRATALFRTPGDFAGLNYYSDEPRQHTGAAYPLDRDYSNTKLSFHLNITGAGMHFSNLSRKPSVTIVSGDVDYYVTLGFLGVAISATENFEFLGDQNLGHPWIKWNSETVEYYKEIPAEQEGDPPTIISGTGVAGTDYVMDYTQGIMRPVENSRIPYAASIHITYRYSSTEDYLIDFGNLYQGEHPNIATPVPAYAVDKVMFPLMSSSYDPGNLVHTGRSDLVVFDFTNWSVQGGEIGSPAAALPNNHCHFAEGYDDEYYQNPQRIIDVMYHLGYRGSIDFYIGASHYYDFYGTQGTEGIPNQHMITDAAKGINPVFEEWFRYFCRAARAKGFTEIVLSISMESLHIPDAWRQKMFDGSPGQSGWEPATSFYSPTNPDVRAWYRKVIRDVLTIMVAEGLPPVLQLGEPWWWWQEFTPGDVTRPYPNRPPCFYDDYTVASYRTEFGEDIPRFESSEIDVDTYRTTLEWLREQLGNFSDYIRSVAREFTNGKYLILFFPPSVLETARVPAAIRMVNVPYDHWCYPNLDRIQIEDYDWLIHENDKHSTVFTFAQSYFGYPSAQVDYFSGFAWDQYKIENDIIVNRKKRKKKPGKIKIKSVSTQYGSVNIRPGNGCYIDVVTTSSSPYNAIILRSEDYHFGDRIYVVNAGTSGMAVHYVDTAWTTPVLIGWVDPGKIIVLIYNGWTAATMWTWGAVPHIEPNGVLHTEETIVETDEIPLDYQWGLIENATRWSRHHGLSVYILKSELYPLKSVLQNA